MSHHSLDIKNHFSYKVNTNDDRYKYNRYLGLFKLGNFKEHCCKNAMFNKKNFIHLKKKVNLI